MYHTYASVHIVLSNFSLAFVSLSHLLSLSLSLLSHSILFYSVRFAFISFSFSIHFRSLDRPSFRHRYLYTPNQNITSLKSKLSDIFARTEHTRTHKHIESEYDMHTLIRYFDANDKYIFVSLRPRVHCNSKYSTA